VRHHCRSTQMRCIVGETRADNLSKHFVDQLLWTFQGIALA